MGAHDFSFTTIDGTPLDMKSLAGKPVLVVNVASYCGFTPQYTDLQALHENYGPRGLVVLGVPCNDFGEQVARRVGRQADEAFGEGPQCTQDWREAVAVGGDGGDPVDGLGVGVGAGAGVRGVVSKRLPSIFFSASTPSPLPAVLR